MTKYLLDTCVLSEFLKRQSNEKVLEWFDEQVEESLYVSVLTIGEIRKGVSRLSESRQKTELGRWLGNVVIRYDGRMLSVNIRTANLWGDLKAKLESHGRPLPVIDSLLAATALEHDLTIVTRNEDDFVQTGAQILNVWN
jgi:Predicted nucleic acid-binding protein, contains PIN domain